MKTYQRILLPTLSCCPSMAQLRRCNELAATGDSKARVVLFIDRNIIVESDGPAGVFPMEDKLSEKVVAARQRLGLLLDRSGLDWVQPVVQLGDPGKLLTQVMKSWQPDLVVYDRGLGHARWVEHAMRDAGITAPDIIDVAADGIFRKLLNALLPLSADLMHFPLFPHRDTHPGEHHWAAR